MNGFIDLLQTDDIVPNTDFNIIFQRGIDHRSASCDHGMFCVSERRQETKIHFTMRIY